MKRRRWYVLIGLLAMLVPAALALALFPTPHFDTREVFATPFFSLTYLKHPPMMHWVAGLTERVFAPTAFWAVLINQILNGIGIVYVYATLRLTVDRDRAMLFAFLLATSAYFTVAPLAYALNADILQIPIWAAILFHAVRATESNRLSHWIALGLWCAAAVYTKYSGIILFVAMGLATVAVPEYRRRIWRNPRFYVAALIGSTLLAPHVFALYARNDSIVYAENRVFSGVSLFTTLTSILWGLLLFLLPAWVFIAVGLVRGDCFLRPTRLASSPTDRFLRATCLAAFGLVLFLVVVMGTQYKARFHAPYLALVILAAAPLIELDRERWPRAECRILWAASLMQVGIVAAACIGYGLFTGHNYLQEPTAEGAAIIRDDWARRYSCGPAYILGDDRSARGLAITGDRKSIGIAVTDLPRASWYDAGLLKREGAAVVYPRPIPVDEIAKYLPEARPTEVKSITLPLLRTHSHNSVTYYYFFIPPESCPAASILKP